MIINENNRMSIAEDLAKILIDCDKNNYDYEVDVYAHKNEDGSVMLWKFENPGGSSSPCGCDEDEFIHAIEPSELDHLDLLMMAFEMSFETICENLNLDYSDVENKCEDLEMSDYEYLRENYAEDIDNLFERCTEEFSDVYENFACGIIDEHIRHCKEY